MRADGLSAASALTRPGFAGPPSPAERERGRTRAALVALALACLPAHAAPLPAPEAGPCSLEQAVPVTVARVEAGLELLLDDGRRAALTGLEFPAPAQGALALLSGWLAGKQVFLAAASASPDRWGRIPAWAFAASGEGAAAPLVSIGEALLGEGLARFRPDPPAAPCAKAYLAAEQSARAQKLGLWAGADAAVLDISDGAASVNQDNEAFLNRKGMTLVEGVVHSIGEARGTIYLNFGPRRARDFAVVISRRDLGMFEQSGLSPRTLIGRRLRVRGLIETSIGPRMGVSSPAQIELLDAAPAR